MTTPGGGYGGVVGAGYWGVVGAGYGVRGTGVLGPTVLYCTGSHCTGPHFLSIRCPKRCPKWCPKGCLKVTISMTDCRFRDFWFLLHFKKVRFSGFEGFFVVFRVPTVNRHGQLWDPCQRGHAGVYKSRVLVSFYGKTRDWCHFATAIWDVHFQSVKTWFYGF